MQGKHFIMLNNDGQIMSAGVIEEKLAEGVYSVRIRNEPPVTRVAGLDVLSAALMFDSEEDVSKWIASNTGPRVQEGESPQEVTPDDLPAGVFDPTSELTPLEQLADHEAEQSRAAG